MSPPFFIVKTYIRFFTTVGPRAPREPITVASRAIRNVQCVVMIEPQGNHANWGAVMYYITIGDIEISCVRSQAASFGAAC
jgi:hypothetical protein